jgi:hypothetical protein
MIEQILKTAKQTRLDFYGKDDARSYYDDEAEMMKGFAIQLFSDLLKDQKIKIVHGKIELFYKDGFYVVINNALKVKTITQSKVFESALQSFWDSIKK